MYLRTLGTEEMHRLYDPCLKRDFPPEELMPWKWMKPVSYTHLRAHET